MTATIGRLSRAVLILSGTAALTIPAALPATSQPAEPGIVGGTTASIAEAPWMVALEDSHGTQFCDGTLFSPTQVITAAHCLQNLKATDITVVGGRTDLSASAPGDTVSAVTSMAIRPGYTSALKGADLAVLNTTVSFPYPALPPATAQDTDLYAAGTVGTVYGWGRLAQDGATTSILHKVDLPVVAESDCATEYQQFMKDGSTYNSDAMFCAGYTGIAKDACQGDSGGPFVVDGKLVGIVSWGIGCGKQPGYYTKVSSYN
jgi:secreted trypsin-like serine protease